MALVTAASADGGLVTDVPSNVAAAATTPATAPAGTRTRIRRR